MNRRLSTRTFLGRTSRAFTPSAAALSALALAALAGESYSQVIGVQFDTSQRNGGGGLTPVLAGPAGVFSAQNWNDFLTNIGGTSTLTDNGLTNDLSATTAVNLSLTANDSWYSDGPVGTPNQSLMKGIVKANGGNGATAGFTLSGLTAGYTYSLIAYTMENGGGSQDSVALSAGANAQATYYVTEQNSFNGTFLQGTNTTSGSFTAPASNYVEWDNLSLDASKSLTLTLTHIAGTDGGGLSGFQLIGYNHWTGTAGDGTPGDGNGIWDIQGASGVGNNWSGTSGYHEGDAVIFDDTGTNTNISIQSGANGTSSPAGVHPGAVVFNNNTSAYVFSGDIIAGPGAVVMNGTGAAIFSNGANTYSGGTTVNAGTLGTAPGSTIGSGPLTINNPNTGVGTTTTVSLGTAQSVSSLSGSIATPSSGTNAAVLTLNATLTVNQSGTTTFPGVIQGPGGFTFGGPGSLTLTAENTFLGGTIVTGGTLVAAAPGGDTNQGTFAVGQAVAVNAGGTLSLTVDDALGYAHYVAGGGSTYNSISELDINGGTVTSAAGVHSSLPAIVFTGGGTLTAAGTGDVGPASQRENFILDGNVTVSSPGSSTAVISAPQITLRGASTTGSGASNVTAGSSVTFNVARGTAATDLLISSAIQDETGGSATAGAGLTKTGNGILTLNATNTYTGGTIINQGTVAVSVGSGLTPLGTGAVTLNGGTLSLQGQTNRGLIANFYSINPANSNNSNPNFVDYPTITAHFATLAAAVTANTLTGGKTSLDFSDDGYGSNAPFNQANPDGTTANYGFTNNVNYEVSMNGFISIPTAGTYNFATTSDDGSVLFINGSGSNPAPVVNNNFYQGAVTRTGSYTFAAPGLYPISVDFYQGGGGQGLLVQEEAPGATSYTTISNSALYYSATPLSSTQTYANNVVVPDNGNPTINVTTSDSAIMGTLTLGHATLNMSGDTGASLTFGSANLTNSGTINVPTADKTITIAGGVTETAGPNSLTKIGNGVLLITGPSTYSGGTSVNGGTLAVTSIGGNNPLGLGTITFGGGTLNLNGQQQSGLTAQFIQDPGNVDNTHFNTLAALNSYFAANIAGNAANVTTLSSAGGKANFDFSNNNYGGANAMFNQAGVTNALFGFNGNSNIEAEFSGYINIPAAGTYNFATTSDDGSVLFVGGGGAQVVNNNFFQGATQRNGNYTFAAPGLYPITIGFYQGGGGEGLLVQYTPPGGTAQTLPNSILTTGAYAATQAYGNAVNVAQNGTINVTNSPTATFGALSINGSSLTVNGTGANVTFSSTGLTGNGVLSPAAGATITTGPISEDSTPRTLNVSGAGTVSVNAAGTYTGGTKVNAGTLSLLNSGGLGAGAVTLNGGVLSFAGTSAALTGFSNFTTNGGATITGGTVQVTDNNNGEARSAFSNSEFSIAYGFSASFTYTGQGGGADGATFAIQSAGATAVGGGGGTLGLPGNSDAVEFNIWNGHVIGTNATNSGLTGGNGGPNYLATGAVNVASNDPIQVQLLYLQSSHLLTETLTDTTTLATFTTSYTLDLTAPLTGAQGYVGFTGATGGANAVQTFSNFSFNNLGPMTVPNNIVVSAGAIGRLDVPQPAVGVPGGANVSGGLTLNSGASLNVTGGASATGTPYSLNVTGATTLSGAHTISVANNGAGLGTATLSGLISESVTPSSLTKTGNGTLIINPPVTGNTFTGGVTIGAGTLATQTVLYGDSTGSAFGSGAVTLAGGTLALQGQGTAAGLIGKYYDQASTATVANPGGVGPASNNFVSLGAISSYYGPLTPTVTARSTLGGFSTFNFGSNPNGNFAGLTGDSTDFPNYSAVNFAAVWTGDFNAPAAAGTSAYTFATASDDGSMLFIDGQLVVNNNFFQGVTQRTGTITLTPGIHTVEVAFYQGTGGYAMSAQVENAAIPGFTSLTDIPQSNVSTLPGFLTVGGASASQTYANSIVVAQDSSISVGNSLQATVGALSIGGHKLSVTSPDSTSSAYSLTTGPVTLTGNANFSVSSSASGGVGSLVPGVISGGANGITKSGNGVLVLGQTNTYSGGTTITAGSVSLTNAAALGSGAVTLNGGVLSIASQGAGASGFSNFSTNGATLSGGNTVATLTDNNGNEGRSLFSNGEFSVANGFTSSFTYTAAGNRGADGAAFVIQSNSPTALGAGGGGLGYGGITNSAALELNIYSGNGGSGTALNFNGVTGANGANGGYVSTGSVNLASGDAINISVSYNAAAQTLTEVLTDPTANSSYSKTFTGVNLASDLTGNAGYIGFSGGTGGVTATQIVSNFSFANYQPLTITNSVNVAAGGIGGLDVAQIPGASAAATLQGALTLNSNSTLNVTGGLGSSSNVPYTLTVTSATTISGNSAVNVANNGTGLGVAVLGNVSESSASSSLTKGGNGMLILSGSSTYTGLTFVNAGTLEFTNEVSLNAASNLLVAPGATAAFNVGGAGQFTSADLDMLPSNAAFEAGSSIGIDTTNAGGSFTYGTAVADTAFGSLGLAKLGTGTLVLTGSNTYSGTTTISGGTLQIGTNGTAGALGTGPVVDNATLVFDRSDTNSLANGISGSGSLTKAGNGALILTGTNSYAGTTTISSGSLQVGANGSTGTLGTGAVVDNTSLVFARAGVYVAPNNISGGGSVSNTGSGVVTLSGINSYSGPTSITAGTLEFGNQVSLYNNVSSNWTTANLVVAPGATAAFGVGGAGQFTSANMDGLLTLGSASGGFENGSNVGFDTATATGGSFTYATAIVNPNGGANSLGVTKLGAGTLVLTGANTYSGVTTASAGTLEFANEVSLYNDVPANWTASNLVVASGATAAFNVGGTGQFTAADIAALAPLGTVSGGFENGSNIGIDTTNAGGSFTYSSAITNTNSGNNSLGLAKLGSGTLILTAANTYSGTTTITAGTLQIGTDGTSGAIGAGPVVDNGAFVFDRSDTNALPNSISGSGSLTNSGNGTLILTGTNTYTGTTTISNGPLQVGANGLVGTLGTGALVDNGSLVFDRSGVYTASNAISGTGAVSNIGSGTVILTGANTYAGITTISSGTLEFGNEAALYNNVTASWTSANIVVASGATAAFGVGGTGQFTSANIAALAALGSASGGFASGSNIGFDTTNANGGSFTYGTAIVNPNAGANTLGVTKLGAGILVLTAANTYTGVTNVSAGTLEFANETSLYNDVPANWTASNLVVASGATAAFNIGGAGQFTASDIASLASLGTAIGGFLPGSSIGLDTTNAGGSFTYASAIVDTNSGSNSLGLTKLGSGTLILTGANTYSGTTSIGAGVLQIGTDGTAGAIGAGPIVDNASFVFDRSDSNTLPNNVSGSGSLTNSGNGTLTLTGANTYGGTTTISAGTLQVGAGGTSGTLGGGAVIDNAALVFNRSDTITVANTISGSGTLAYIGSGTVILTGSNSYAGATTISSGSVQVGAGGTAGTLGTGAVTDNGTLVLDRSDTVTVPNSISGSGSLTYAGTGIAILTGANSYGGTTTISSGVLQVGAGGTAGTLGSSVVVDNATLVFARSDTFTVSNSIFGSGVVTNIGSGTLNLNGMQSYSTLNANSGITNVNSALGTGASILNANGGTTNLGASQTLDQLNLGASAAVAVNAASTVNNVTFTGTSASTATIIGSSNLTINAAADATYAAGVGITVSSGAATATISAPIVLGASQTWTNNSSNALSVTNTVTGAGSTALTTAGPGTINLNGAQNYATLNTGAGTTNVNALLGSGSSNLNVNGATNLSPGAGATQVLSALNVGSATHPSPTLALLAHTPFVPANGNTVVVNNTFGIQGGFTNPTGTIDIQNNAMVIKATTGIGLSQVASLVYSGLNFGPNGYYDGPGISSSNAANDPNGVTGVGYIDNSQWGYTSITGSSFGFNTSGPGTGIIDGSSADILVKYTYFGDTNLDGVVDFTDYLDFLAGYNGQQAATWLYGDFLGTGTVDFNNYLYFQAGYNASQGGGLPPSGGNGGGSGSAAPSTLSAPAAVPEPTTFGLVAVGALGVMIRRRRQTRG